MTPSRKHVEMSLTAGSHEQRWRYVAELGECVNVCVFFQIEISLFHRDLSQVKRLKVSVMVG